MDIDLPDVLTEVTAQFERYEKALVGNDVAVLDELFHKDARSLRYGIGENLYGHSEITAFRAARSPIGLNRRTARTLITHFPEIVLHIARQDVILLGASGPP